MCVFEERVAIGCLTAVSLLFVLLFSSFGGLSFRAQSEDEALFYSCYREDMIRVGKIELVRTCVRGGSDGSEVDGSVRSFLFRFYLSCPRLRIR